MAASESDKRDPIAQAMANWERAGWGEVAQGMVAVASVMRAQIPLTILLGRRPIWLAAEVQPTAGARLLS